MVRKAQPLFTPEPPGKVLKKYIIEINGITQEALATAMDVSRLTVNQIINGKRSITADTALRLALVLNTTPEFWLNLQRDLDLFEAQRELESKRLKLSVLRKSSATSSQHSQ